MKTTTVKGTSDYLPAETALRDEMQAAILGVYRAAGYEHITTPILEDMENLDKSDGGDNLNLIFKILKRGEKFDEAVAAGDYAHLADMGLRYDLTLPLCRYYANNKATLPAPFKAIQIDRVYRAERPQKGRMREFVQCDIDILGDASSAAELDLIVTTASALEQLGIGAFRIRINNRIILRSILSSLGFAAETLDSVCISFDKLDKIGADGVLAELREKSFPEEAIAGFAKFLENKPETPEDAAAFGADPEAVRSLREIMDAATALSDGTWDVAFDVSLVRGQGYYTGTVFEVESKLFRGAVGGGGRYDHLVGKFIGEDVPAVGFSIGFERIYGILKEQNAASENKARRAVVFFEGETPADALPAQKRAAALRADGWSVTVAEMPKKLGKALSRYAERGFTAYMVEGKDDALKDLQ